MLSWGFVRSFIGKLSLVLALGVASGCVSGLPPEPALWSPSNVGPTLDSPHIIRVCVKQPGVPRHKDFWAIDGSGHLVLEDSELGQYQRNGQSIYYFDPDANPASARMLPIPHNTQKCVEPTRSVLSSNGKVSPPKPTQEVQQQGQRAAQTNTKRVAGAEPPACANTIEPGQQRRSRTTTTQTCVRSRTLKAPTRPAPAAVAKSEAESPALAQAAPEPVSTASPLVDWKVGAPNLSGSGLDPQRVLECVGSLCHARHQNFVKKGANPAVSGLRESRSLSSGGGGGAKVTKGATRKPPTGPKPAATAKPAANATNSPPQTTTTTVAKGKPSSIAPAEARPGKPFRPRDKQQVIDDNRQRNGGAIKCENCTVGTVPGQKSQKGITPPRNETQIDHKEPRSKGGSGTAENGQVLCRSCNREKSNK